MRKSTLSIKSTWLWLNLMAETVVKCPICDRPVAWRQDNTFRPFCSKRCQLIDLGEWASGGRSIESEADSVDFTEDDQNGNSPG